MFRESLSHWLLSTMMNRSVPLYVTCESKTHMQYLNNIDLLRNDPSYTFFLLYACICVDYINNCQMKRRSKW
jgi:hypothetical protein